MTYRLHDSLGFRLSRAARIQERRLDAGLKTLGLTRITWCVLLAVGNEDLAQPSEIADFVGIDRTAASRALRQMEADGLVARHVGEGDGRTREVVLTPLGRDRLTRGEPMAVENNACNSKVAGMKLPAMIAGNYEPHFSLNNMFKDSQFALTLAKAAGVDIPALATTAGSMYQTIKAGRGIPPGRAVIGTARGACGGARDAARRPVPFSSAQRRAGGARAVTDGDRAG